MTKHQKVVEVPDFAWRQSKVPDHPVAQKIGAYYGNPVVKNKAKKMSHKKEVANEKSEKEALELLHKV